MKTRLVLFCLCGLASYSTIALAAQTAADPSPDIDKQYLEVRVDQVVIDTQGLVAVSQEMSRSIDTLALAIQTLASQGADLSDEEKSKLLSAVRSVDQASLALTDLAQQIPQTAQNFSDQLPRVVSEARQTIIELSRGLNSARDGLLVITEALPQATENAKELVNSTLDAALLRILIFASVLFVVFALLLVIVVYYIYRAYLDPLATKLAIVAAAPEHFAAMSRHMQQTSANLLALQNLDATSTAAPPVAAKPAPPSLSSENPE